MPSSTSCAAPGFDGAAAAGGVRRPAAGDHPLVFGAARLRPDGDRDGPRDQLLGPRLPAGGGGQRAVARLVPRERLLVETDAPFLSPPGAPRKRNEPEWVRVTAAWLAEQRGESPDALGDGLVAAYDFVLGRG